MDNNNNKKSVNMSLWTILVVLCVFCARNVEAMCEPVKAPLCANMPYNLTEMPNVFNHPTQENAVLGIEQYQALVNTGCSKVLRFFLCTMYFPICAVTDSVLKPCRSLCEEAKEGCLPIMMRYNVSWPDNLACEELPDYEKGLCVMPQTIIQDPSSTPPKDIVIPRRTPDIATDIQTGRGRRPNGRQRPDQRRKEKNEKKVKKTKEERRQEKADRKRERKQMKMAKKEERRQKRQRRRKRKGTGSDVLGEDLLQDQEAATTRAPTAVMAASAPCVCQPPRQIKKELKTNAYTYKIKAAWTGLERSADGSTLMKFKLMDTFAWPNEGYPENGDIVTLMTNKTCICPRFKENRSYLVAGYGAGANLSYDVALKWKPILKKWVEKGSNGKKGGKGVRKEKKQKMKQRRRNKPERKQKKDDRRKNRRKNRKGRNDDKKQKPDKKEQKKKRKEERKKRKKEKKRSKWGTTEVPLLEWSTTAITPTEKPAL